MTSPWSLVGSPERDGGSVFKILEALCTIQETSEGSEWRARWLGLMKVGVETRAGVPETTEVPIDGGEGLLV